MFWAFVCFLFKHCLVREEWGCLFCSTTNCDLMNEPQHNFWGKSVTCSSFNQRPKDPKMDKARRYRGEGGAVEGRGKGRAGLGAWVRLER